MASYSFNRIRLRYCVGAMVVLLTTSLYLHRSLRTESLPQPQEVVIIRPTTDNLRSLPFSNFTAEPPEWLLPPKESVAPLVVRLAIVSRINERSRRDTVRTTWLRGVPRGSVALEYRFFVAVSNDTDKYPGAAVFDQSEYDDVRKEAKEHGDIDFLDMAEGGRYMGEKRHLIFRWGASADSNTYDWFMGADTDVFARLDAIGHRFRHLRPGVDPRKAEVLWAHMLSHRVHFTLLEKDRSQQAPHTGPMDNKWYEDTLSEGDWYSYPIGGTYLMSSALMRTLYAHDSELPIHIEFPSDDVMLGIWVNHFAPKADILDDFPGFHDVMNAKGDDNIERPISYDTISVHHVHDDLIHTIKGWPEWAKLGEFDLD